MTFWVSNYSYRKSGWSLVTAIWISTLAYLCRRHKQHAIELLAVTVDNDGMGTPGRALTHVRAILERCGLRARRGTAEGDHLARYEVTRTGVLLDGPSAGRAVDMSSGTPQRVAIWADQVEFERHFRTALNGGGD